MFGHGTFIYNPDYAIKKYGSPDNVAQALAKMGMTHAWVRGHSKNGLWKVAANKKLTESFRGRGISVGVWGWCDGNNIKRDIDNVKEAVQIFRPDCYIADIENLVSGAKWDTKRADDFGGEIKSFLGNIPLVVSSFGYIGWHEPEIMSALDQHADYFAPQVYWFRYPSQRMLNQNPSLKLELNNPADYTRVCLENWRRAVNKPLIVTGQAYWGESSSWTQKQAEKKLGEFLSGFKDLPSLAGLNWWNFAAEKAMSQTMIDMIKTANISGQLSSKSATSETVEEKEPTTTARLTTSKTLYWVAAEGLKFRATPDNGTEENVLTELDYGDSAEIAVGLTSNGYVKSTVSIDGIDTEGYLFANYLRENETPLVERAIQEATSEWLRFNKGAGIEDKHPFSGYINEMWTARGYPDLTGEDRSWYWSAAFISWILENAGYENTKFDIRHSTYINEAIQNRVLSRQRDFWAYRLDEVSPQVGDILCQWRGDYEITYDQAETRSKFESHTDIVIAVRPRAVITLGGNVTNESSNGRGVTVGTKTFRRSSDGRLVDERRLFAIMKNQFRDRADQKD